MDLNKIPSTSAETTAGKIGISLAVICGSIAFIMLVVSVLRTLRARKRKQRLLEGKDQMDEDEATGGLLCFGAKPKSAGDTAAAPAGAGEGDKPGFFARVMGKNKKTAPANSA